MAAAPSNHPGEFPALSPCPPRKVDSDTIVWCTRRGWYQRLVRGLARRYRGVIHPDVLDGLALVGLWKALERHDFRRGRSLSTSIKVYATWQCQDYLRKEQRQKKRYYLCQPVPLAREEGWLRDFLVDNGEDELASPRTRSLAAFYGGVREMDKAKLAGVLASVVKGMKFISAITPTKLDDQVVAALEALVGQDWFLDVLAWAMDAMKRGDDPVNAIKEKLGLS